MLGIKPFVQESVHALPPAQLRLLAETLRIDLRGCEDRGDIERVLTGLVCLNQDTSLGVFLAWLRSIDQQKNGLLASKKPAFTTTFLPAISSSNQTKNDVKDHHLDDEIKQQLQTEQKLQLASNACTGLKKLSIRSIISPTNNTAAKMNGQTGRFRHEVTTSESHNSSTTNQTDEPLLPADRQTPPLVIDGVPESLNLAAT